MIAWRRALHEAPKPALSNDGKIILGIPLSEDSKFKPEVLDGRAPRIDLNNKQERARKEIDEENRILNSPFMRMITTIKPSSQTNPPARPQSQPQAQPIGLPAITPPTDDPFFEPRALTSLPDLATKAELEKRFTLHGPDLFELMGRNDLFPPLSSPPNSSNSISKRVGALDPGQRKVKRKELRIKGGRRKSNDAIFDLVVATNHAGDSQESRHFISDIKESNRKVEEGKQPEKENVSSLRQARNSFPTPVFSRGSKSPGGARRPLSLVQANALIPMHVQSPIKVQDQKGRFFEFQPLAQFQERSATTNPPSYTNAHTDKHGSNCIVTSTPVHSRFQASAQNGNGKLRTGYQPFSSSIEPSSRIAVKKRVWCTSIWDLPPPIPLAATADFDNRRERVNRGTFVGSNRESFEDMVESIQPTPPRMTSTPYRANKEVKRPILHRRDATNSVGLVRGQVVVKVDSSGYSQATSVALAEVKVAVSGVNDPDVPLSDDALADVGIVPKDDLQDLEFDFPVPRTARANHSNRTSGSGSYSSKSGSVRLVSGSETGTGADDDFTSDQHVDVGDFEPQRSHAVIFEKKRDQSRHLLELVVEASFREMEMDEESSSVLGEEERIRVTRMVESEVRKIDGESPGAIRDIGGGRLVDGAGRKTDKKPGGGKAGKGAFSLREWSFPRVRP
jgi:hypothetical protein